MRLTVDYGYVCVEEVPSDYTDFDVRADVEALAKEGSEAAKWALAQVPGTWVNFNCNKGSTRLYLDGVCV